MENSPNAAGTHNSSEAPKTITEGVKNLDVTFGAGPTGAHYVEPVSNKTSPIGPSGLPK